MNTHKTEKNTKKEIHALIHDLRNLLSAIYNFTQILELSFSTHEMEKEKKIVQHIYESAQKMEHLMRVHTDSAQGTEDTHI